MNSFVNITGNLIPSTNADNVWLIANGKTKYKCLWQGNVSLVGYDVLGISAEFRSWLNNYNDLVSGAYGIQIDIVSKKATSQTEGTPLYYTFYFSSKEMLGDPYNYDTFYLQEKTFDISGIKQIDAIRIGFFQDGDFKSNTSGYLIAQEEEIAQNANLFINNPVVAIGYNASRFKEDTVLLNTSDSEMYLTGPTEQIKINYPKVDYNNESAVQNLIYTLNTKNIDLRWVHLLTEEEQSGVYNASSTGISATRLLTIADFADYDQPFNIKWYQYVYDENADYSNVIWDANAGEYWNELVNNKNKFSLQAHPDIKKPEEQYKAIIEYPSMESTLDSIEEYLDQRNGLYELRENILADNKVIIKIPGQNNTETDYDYLKGMWNNSVKTALVNQNTNIYSPIYSKLKALQYMEAEKITELQEITEEYTDYNRTSSNWPEKVHVLVYNTFLDLYYTNTAEFTLELAAEIETLKKNNIEDSQQFEQMATNIITTSSVFEDVRKLKLFFPQFFGYATTFLDSGYTNYQTNIYNFLSDFKTRFLADIDNNTAVTNAQEKSALKIIQTIIRQIIDIDTDIENYRNSEIGKIEYYSSLPIIFKNTDPTASLNKIKDALSNLEIVVDEEGYQGVYNLYEEDGHIQNDNDANETRILEAKYEKYSSDSNPVANDEIITWRIPLINTMIQTPEEGVEYNQYDECTKTVYNASGVVTTQGEVTRENYTSSKYYYYNDTVAPYKYIQITPESVAASNLINFYNSVKQFYKRNSTKVTEENGYMIISRQGDPIQEFRLKPFCEASLTNNEIFCTVQKDLINLEASTTLSFSPVGNSGTNYTFYLEFYDNQNQFALPAMGFTEDEKNKKKHELKVRARLFNEIHREITNENSFTWTLLGGVVRNNTKVIGAELGATSGPINIIRSKSPTGTTWDSDIFSNLIIKCQCKTAVALGDSSKLMEMDDDGNIIAAPPAQNKKDITLTAYLSIPVIKNKQTIGGYAGSGLISYSSSGTDPYYYNGSFKVYNKNLQEIKYIADPQNNYWKIFGVESGEANYFPKITPNGSLSVPSIYMQENQQISLQFVKDNIVEFILPLRIYKRVYFLKAINSWDGSLTLNENDGIILSTMMGAGYKDDLNRFNGILMGDMALAEGESDNLYYSGTGLYGYSEGYKSFGFNINGYGFIGRNGSGQILFDGNSGIITSANFAATNNGMKIDVDNGTILLRKNNAEAFLSPGSNKDGDILDFFRIKDTSGGYLIRIAGDGSAYYLQSEGFQQNVKGLRFDLKNGALLAFSDFYLYSKSNNNSIFALSNEPNQYFMIHDGLFNTTIASYSSQAITLKSPNYDTAATLTANYKTYLSEIDRLEDALEDIYQSIDNEMASITSSYHAGNISGEMYHANMQALDSTLATASQDITAQIREYQRLLNSIIAAMNNNNAYSAGLIQLSISNNQLLFRGKKGYVQITTADNTNPFVVSADHSVYVTWSGSLRANRGDITYLHVGTLMADRIYMKRSSDHDYYDQLYGKNNSGETYAEARWRLSAEEGVSSRSFARVITRTAVNKYTL